MNQIIENKRSNEAEFFVNLFEWCNMKCSFCWQDHDKWDGVETIVERSQDIIEQINKDNRNYFIVNLMGGELFADEIPYYVFDEYIRLVTEIESNLKNTGKTFHVNWVTNLVYEKTDRVTNLIDTLRGYGISTKLTTSFDFVGRFNKRNRDLFWKNVYDMKEYIGTVSVVLTKPNIKHLIKNKDELFKKMYKDGFYFYFDYYSPEESYAINAPSDKELQGGLKFLSSEYPNTWPVNGWINQDINKMTCMGSMIIDHTGFKGQCRALLTGNIKEKMKTESKDSEISNLEESFVNKYNCIQCEFYNRCGMGCFLQHDFKGKEEMEECLYKGVYRFIDDKYK